jgi:hypothetical protein
MHDQPGLRQGLTKDVTHQLRAGDGTAGHDQRGFA